MLRRPSSSYKPSSQFGYSPLNASQQRHLTKLQRLAEAWSNPWVLALLLSFLMLWTGITTSMLMIRSRQLEKSVNPAILNWEDSLLPSLSSSNEHLEIPVVTTTPEESPHYPVTPGDSEGELQWNLQFPQGGGFITLDSPSSTGKSSTPSPKRKYDVAMYHQLRCLGALRSSLERPWSKRWAEEGEKEHIKYCLSYLRQTTLCHADTTLEPAVGPNLVLETRQRHLCRDWEKVYDFVERSNERSGEKKAD